MFTVKSNTSCLQRPFLSIEQSYFLFTVFFFCQMFTTFCTFFSFCFPEACICLSCQLFTFWPFRLSCQLFTFGLFVFPVICQLFDFPVNQLVFFVSPIKCLVLFFFAYPVTFFSFFVFPDTCLLFYVFPVTCLLLVLSSFRSLVYFWPFRLS